LTANGAAVAVVSALPVVAYVSTRASSGAKAAAATAGGALGGEPLVHSAGQPRAGRLIAAASFHRPSTRSNTMAMGCMAGLRSKTSVSPYATKTPGRPGWHGIVMDRPVSW